MILKKLFKNVFDIAAKMSLEGKVKCQQVFPERFDLLSAVTDFWTMRMTFVQTAICRYSEVSIAEHDSYYIGLR